MAEVSDETAAEYCRIARRAAEDPGTAGDEGEENWAGLMREWLPSHWHVETKGRILAPDGSLSPQLDVLVLHPSYPKKLQKKKTYLASAVLAAFECKLTLRSEDIAGVFKTASALHNIQPARECNPHDELNHRIIFGLLAHSHSWKRPTSDAHANIQNGITKGHTEIATCPGCLPDFLCVADLGTWSTLKFSSAGILLRDFQTGQLPPDTPAEVDAMPVTEYMKPMPVNVGHQTTPIGAMFAKLLSRLSFEESAVRPLSDAFRLAGLSGSGQGFSTRLWPSPYSAAVRANMPMRLVNDGFSRWGIAFG